MDPIRYIDRTTKTLHEEQIYGLFFVRLLYGQYPFSGLLGGLLRCMAKWPITSSLYGRLQKASFSKQKVAPFIEKYQINMEESEKKPNQFTSFNDFFIRKLKKNARPFNPDPTKAIMPADGRYLFFPKIDQSTGFYVKGQKFSLKSFLKDSKLAKRYEKGTLVLARLCPTDYHRFHFPCSGIPEKSISINGPLSSVNLASLKQNINVFCENKRMLTLFNTEHFGEVVIAEIGAVCVGTIHQTYSDGNHVSKGEEKGYFSFGGSSMALLFEPDRIQLEEDLIDSPPFTEILCKFGEPLGKAL